MNESLLRNSFKHALNNLISDVTQSIDSGETDPYEKSRVEILHEHNTRIHFFDRLMTILGWSLGSKGNVAEEVRIKAETMRFMDYVGLKEDTKAPLIILEAKAWNKSFVSARNPEERATDDDLIAAAIRHILNDGSGNDSPVSNQWHAYLKQIMGYVRTMKVQYDHDTPCAVLSSGKWTVIFTKPVLTFVNGKVSTSNIKIFSLETYNNDADDLFDLLHRSVLSNDIPFPLRPSQIREYIEFDSITATFYGVHVHYEETGSMFFGPKPKILIYPLLILQRNDGVFAIISNLGKNSTLEYTKNNDTDLESLTVHIDSVISCIDELHHECEEELNNTLIIHPIEHFPGFPSTSPVNNSKIMVKSIRNVSNAWLVVTGTEKHYLRNSTVIKSCRFHSWAECHTEGCANGSSAISTRSTNPRVIFIDKEIHHCANQTVYDRRKKNCHILSIDERICCQTCNYFNLCWTQAEQEKLPCGK